MPRNGSLWLILLTAPFFAAHVPTIRIEFLFEVGTRSIVMSEPVQAWVVIHPKTAVVSILVDESFRASLVAFAQRRGISLVLIAGNALSKGGKPVNIEYRTSLSEADAKHLLSDWEAWREQSLA